MSPPTYALLPGNYTALGYQAIQVARESGRPMPAGGSADYHLQYDRETLIQLSEAMDRDNAVYKGILGRALDNIVGGGFKLEARTSNPDVNQTLEDLWSAFWKRPEVRGLFSGTSVERNAMKALWIDGDIGAIKTDSGLLQMIEAERIVAANPRNGVTVDSLGKPEKFWVCEYGRGGMPVRSSAKSYEPANFVFVANLERFSQTRGVPVMVPSFAMVHRINDTCDSEAIAWQMLARWALISTTETGPEEAYRRSADDGQGAESPPRQDVRVEDYGNALIFNGRRGEDLKGVERNIPGANFPDAVRMFLRLAGLPFGMPLELILLDWSQSNYSSSKAALEQAYRVFIGWQRLMKDFFHGPIYEWQVRRWIASKKVAETPDILKHEWIAPSWPWLDFLKEVEGWGAALDRGLATQTQGLASRGMDRGEFLKQREREIDEAIQKADGLNQKHPGAKVDWRMFAGLSVAPQAKTAAPAEQVPPTGGKAQ